MNPNHLDQQQILSFLAVAETGSFSAAARRLHLTQPAISKRVALLEAQLGFELFERLPKRLELTETGSALLPAARRLRQALDDFAECPQAVDAAHRGRLSIALSHYAGLHLLPAALEAFNRQHPAVLLDLRFVESETALALVSQGQVRLAYATLAGGNSTEGNFAENTASRTDAGIRLEPLWQERLVPLGAVRQVRNETAEFWRTQPMILPAANTSTRQLIDHWLRRNGLAPTAVIEVNQLDSIALLVGTGIGWSVLPETLMHEKICPISALNRENPVRELGLMRLADRPITPLAAAFMATVAAHRDNQNRDNQN